MLNLKTILNLGTSNPLVLGMGHPVKVRLGRLMRPALLRGGSIMALVLVGSGLVGTSFARSNPVRFVMPEAAISYYNTETQVKIMHMKMSPEQIVFSFNEPNEKFVGITDDKKLGFLPLAGECIEYARSNSAPIVFKDKGQVYEYESTNTKYQIWCVPGTETERSKYTQADYIAGIQASYELSASEKVLALENMQFSEDTVQVK